MKALIFASLILFSLNSFAYGDPDDEPEKTTPFTCEYIVYKSKGTTAYVVSYAKKNGIVMNRTFSHKAQADFFINPVIARAGCTNGFHYEVIDADSEK